MNSQAHIKNPKSSSEERSKPAWFATSTVLDISSAIGSAHLQRLIPPFKKLWQKTFGTAV